MYKFFHTLDVGVTSINKTIAVVGIAAGTLLTFVNVVMRYVFNSGFAWAGEMTNYLFIWSAFFGAAYGFKKGIHISVTILIEKFPPQLAKIYVVFSHILTMVFLLFIVVYSIQYLQILNEMDFMSVDLSIPQWIPMLVLPIAFLGASYRAGQKIIEVANTPADQVIKNAEAELVHDAVSASKD
ncbi:TRAP transporter small permease [Campylobacter sp. faydin G-24]|uniref:TRAP transporter small permease n=1 Tax=Campylobacter anatolicus TaxID=2829105 RepID=A0ABS5HKJ8_9BACT|nr:TRAP transporter small permease [Campylobacter anatolicus]MBR8461529.1 TRAP transporter small permease [Campylobacter anatolicus]MBR8464187.1 TRAP transporter small permease [Campylobacter anatolicus]MBR8466093.1 TRAP transporter small permease [Campylobacter anatolicus]